MVRVQSVTGAGVLISASAPVSGTGTGFGHLPSRERGYMVGFVLLLPRPVDTALKPV